MDRYYDVMTIDDNMDHQNDSATFASAQTDLCQIPGTSSTDNVQNPINQILADDNTLQVAQSQQENSVQSSDNQIPAGSSEDKETELDKDILDLLGEEPSKDKKYGQNLKNELAVRWLHILTTGLKKETRKDLLEKYLIPENCKNIDAPILNPETKAALSETLVKKDKAIESKQKQRAAALSSLGEALTCLFDLGFKETSVIKPLLDAARLICDLQHHDSLIRRSFICSTLKKEVKDQLYNTEIDKYLFSEKLADTLKAAKAIQKSGTDMKISSQVKTKKSAAANRPLNSKPPLPSNRPAGVSRKQEPASEPNRRYQTAQPTTSAPAHSKPKPRSQVHRRR